MLPFSQRYGLKPVRAIIQIDDMDEALRIGLWNAFYNWYACLSVHTQMGIGYSIITDFLRKPAQMYDERTFENFLYEWFRDSALWYEVYDLMEFCTGFRRKDLLAKECNRALERDMSGFRFISGEIVAITNEQEIKAVELATRSKDKCTSSCVKHLKRALELLSDRQNPDYRNSIKESISAVEAACKLITGEENATLGAMLNTLSKKGGIPPALKSAFSSLYGYTSEEGGIRHALTEGTRSVSFDEAKFMLVTCSAFVNYLQPTQI
jgi:hypothetical protein